MPISLAELLATVASIFRSRAALELENLALRHQIDVLQRSARKRPKLTSGEAGAFTVLQTLTFGELSSRIHMLCPGLH
jgi:hypothetical protein